MKRRRNVMATVCGMPRVETSELHCCTPGTTSLLGGLASLGGTSLVALRVLGRVEPLGQAGDDRAEIVRAVVYYNCIRRIPPFPRFEVVHMPTPRIPVDVDNLVRRYNAGESIRKISAAVGVSEKVVRKRLLESGTELREFFVSQETTGAILARYAAGETQGQIAESLGIHQATVSNLLARHGARIGRGDAAVRRWERMSAADRQALVRPAHDAARGVKRTESELEARAITNQRKRSHVHPGETALAEVLTEHGLSVVQQQACGRYNIDLAVNGTVAVELFGGGWHGHGRHLDRLPQRTKRIADAGWAQMFVWVVSHRPFSMTDVANDVIAYIESAGSDPASRREYRVIWGDGQLHAAGSVDDHEVALVPPAIASNWSWPRD